MTDTLGQTPADRFVFLFTVYESLWTTDTHKQTNIVNETVQGSIRFDIKYCQGRESIYFISTTGNFASVTSF